MHARMVMRMLPLCHATRHPSPYVHAAGTPAGGLGATAHAGAPGHPIAPIPTAAAAAAPPTTTTPLAWGITAATAHSAARQPWLQCRTAASGCQQQASASAAQAIASGYFAAAAAQEAEVAAAAAAAIPAA